MVHLEKSKLGLASSSVKDRKLMGWYAVLDYLGARVVLVPHYPGSWGGTCTRLPCVCEGGACTRLPWFTRWYLYPATLG
ncbi:hypothetical protein RHMOL_Rhmol10G0192800 [Rhododendron molle]|uniref:Uncharacterized protein n=1 Tax=Rhododendron molle TaxID=49168 RepID=A0ACC0M3Q3_RHOML|nr:hypothetical protein RHMOL_Rhmol10G0192800 [Rhododendron molle]